MLPPWPETVVGFGWSENMQLLFSSLTFLLRDFCRLRLPASSSLRLSTPPLPPPSVCLSLRFLREGLSQDLECGRPVWGNAAWGTGVETGKLATEKVGRPHEGVFLPESLLQAAGAQHALCPKLSI